MRMIQGTVQIKIDVKFDPSVDKYPSGSMDIKADLSDSLKGSFSATSIDMINSFGKHSPCIFLTGRCEAQSSENVEIPKGCKYWVMIADNKSKNDKKGKSNLIGPCKTRGTSACRKI